jgi:hypothetical protein
VFSLGCFFLLETWAIQFGPKKKQKRKPNNNNNNTQWKDKVKGCHAIVVEENIPKRKF